LVINTAAFHNVPLCETEREKALRINCMAVQDLAILCREEGERLINFSTDYVFGGGKILPTAKKIPRNPFKCTGYLDSQENMPLWQQPHNMLLLLELAVCMVHQEPNQRVAILLIKEYMKLTIVHLLR
jgi:hypothetical protein